ncbi:putative ABC transporter ATP-binding protein [Pigmentiphaga humi]|uniref:Putative ABC transporter ATP-binding protein n=1 Tax=Pigmentiphaga humi TaxID=2478468 RepID=A0A3P4B2T2_9BURK|nr:ATP-binding cassette domain-containing protein [Pigmentiphaga humi]VCU69856.1 putative ABC transporter ATP-binding protein [Pigmentiphaga humi]
MKHSRDTAALLAVLRLFLAGRTRLLLGGAALACLATLAGMALLGLAGWFLTATAIAGLAAGTALAFDVFTPGAGIRLLALLRTGARYGERVVSHDAALAVLAAVRRPLFLGWARPEAARRLAARPARLLHRLTTDVDALDALYLRLLVPAATALLAALAAGVALGWHSWAGGLALTGWLAASGAGIVAWTARRSRGAARRRAYAAEILRAQAIDLVTGQADLAMAGRLRAQHDTVLRSEARLARADDALNRLDVRGGLAQGAAWTCALAGALAGCAWLVQAGAMGAPVAAMVLLTVFATGESLAPLRRGALELGRTLIAARRLAPHLAEPAASAARPARGAIAVERVRLLNATVSFHIPDGQRVAIIGASGAGKSTLLGLLAGERTPPSGRLAAPACCLLTQRTELFRDSVRDNLLLAAPDASDAQLWQALHAAGLDDHVAAQPGGLDTRLGEGGLGLSGGQARRLALARLLLRPVGLWLLDEPTEGLDGATARDVLARLDQHAAGRTLVIATHIRREAALADRLLVLRDGAIQADLRRGTPAFEHQLDTLRTD